MILYHRKEAVQQNKQMEKIKRLISLLLDIILPRDPEITKIENMSEIEILNNIPQASEIKDDRFKALFQYKNKISKRAIWAIKYEKNYKIAQKFSNLLYDFILENISDEIIFYQFNNPLLISIPMYKNDFKKRGYNQSELIINELVKTDKNKNFTISLNAITKIKETPHQSKLKNKTDRLKNLKNCFYADEKIVAGKNIILIDDVITTGTTMSEAAKTLINAGAKKVIGFSLAH